MLIVLATEAYLIIAQDMCTDFEGELLQHCLVIPRLKIPTYHSTTPGGAHTSSLAMVTWNGSIFFLLPTTPILVSFLLIHMDTTVFVTHCRQFIEEWDLQCLRGRKRGNTKDGLVCMKYYALHVLMSTTSSLNIVYSPFNSTAMIDALKPR